MILFHNNLFVFHLKMSQFNFIDLFAGAGGLSEGFIRAGFNPIAHVEINTEACNTLKTRLAFHYLSSKKTLDIYNSYLTGNISRKILWYNLPEHLLTSVICREISEESFHDITSVIDAHMNQYQAVDVLIGGPPCQAYSLAGRSRDPNRMSGDKRNYLFRHYAKFLEYYKPSYFVFENVVGLLSAGNRSYFDEMHNLFQEKGYSTDFRILNAEEFGVLQKRKRVLIMGRRGDSEFTFPQLKTTINRWQIKDDLFYDLPFLVPGQELGISGYTKPANDYLRNAKIRDEFQFVTQHIARSHNERDLEIYRIAIDKWINKNERLRYSDLPERLRTHKNTESFLDRYKVIDPRGLSHTIVAHIAKDGHHYIYPDQEQVRSISVREAARIQSFPDNYYFEGGRTSAFKQIGNAVPPLMAQAIAEKIYEMI